VSTGWVRATLCALAITLAVVANTSPGAAASRPTSSAPVLTLETQTPWVQASAPWFALSVGVGDASIPKSQLHVSLTFYGRIGDVSQFDQALTSTPNTTSLLHLPDVAVTSASGTRTAAACVTVVADSSVTPPIPSPTTSGGCVAGGPTVDLHCTPETGYCGDVYPVSVALLRTGSNTPLARFTTFLTYEEPDRQTSALRVGLVVPVGTSDTAALADTLSDHHTEPVTLAVSPRAAAGLAAHHQRAGGHILSELAGLTANGGPDQLISQPYAPINLVGLQGSGLGGEITAQLGQGDTLLRQAGLHPDEGAWVDTTTNLTAADSGDLSNGLGLARAHTLVLSDADLASSSANERYTFAGPFSLDGLRSSVTALAADSSLDSRFNAAPADPVLEANQLLGGLSFVHYENAFLTDARGVVLVPPAGWRASSTLVNALLAGLSANPALTPVTLNQLMTQVPVGGNDEPSTRRLQAGPGPTGALSKTAVSRIVLARQHLASMAGAIPGHTSVLVPLSNRLLDAEAQGLSPVARQVALDGFDHAFDHLLSAISLATERTITFTSSSGPIPITVLSSAPYPVHVVLSVASDKFVFPGGGSQRLTLDRATTPIRVEAKSRTSGDRLPVELTLRTPDGQLVIAHATVTVHSTAISIVGIALTVLAGLVLLVWWARTWRRSRRHRPRAH
jgi:hypothetical protein